MRTTTRSNRSGRGQRGAFTLVELLVVITIMAALMALTASAVLKFIGVQQTSNTQSTLDRVQSQLIKAWSKALEQAKTEPIPLSFQTWVATTQIAGTDANATRRMRVIYVKMKMRQVFPMTFGEAMNVTYHNPTLTALGYNPVVAPSPLLALPAYYSIDPRNPLVLNGYLPNHGILPAAVTAQAAPDPRESAVCLLMALQRGVSGAGINPEDLTAGGAAGDYNGMPYLTDAWGRPIFFSRAPAGSPYLNPAYPAGSPGANDPGDPEGTLLSKGWGTTYGQLFTPLTLQVTAPLNSSYKLAPMVASGGPSDWSVRGTVATPASSFDPITFATVPGSDALFSTP